MKYIKYLPIVLLSLSTLKGIMFGFQFTDAPIIATLGFLSYQLYFLEEKIKSESANVIKLDQFETKVYRELGLLSEETKSLRSRVDSLNAKNMMIPRKMM